MSEKYMRGQVVKALKSLHAIPAENPISPGTPDVNYAEGWIELKFLPKWPKNCNSSPVLIPHYTEKQRNWIRKRSQVGEVFLMLKVGKEWMLFEPVDAVKLVGHVTKEVLLKNCCGYWKNFLNVAEFKECLNKNT